jgi:N-acetylglucosaminyl-diphospho-decaprenol L-rhamnosyltransferase
MNSATPRVSILIVTYNSSAVIRACLSGLKQTSDHEVIVVDNLSTDQTVSIIRDEFPKVRVIENSTNAGFSQAVNKAAVSSRGTKLLLLNPDAVITSQVVTQLASELDMDESIGAISPLLEHEGDDIFVIAAGRAPTIWRMFLHQTGLSRFGRRLSLLEGNYLFRNDFQEQPKDVDWTSGGCLMVRTSAWDLLGGLTDRWFMYAEDVELCLRVRSIGKRVVVDPRVTATHAVGGSSGNVEGRVNTMWITNLYDLYSWRIAPTKIHAFVWKNVMLGGMLGREAVYRWQGFMSPDRKTEARANIRRYGIYRKALRAAKPAERREHFILADPGHRKSRKSFVESVTEN